MPSKGVIVALIEEDSGPSKGDSGYTDDAKMNSGNSGSGLEGYAGDYLGEIENQAIVDHGLGAEEKGREIVSDIEKILDVKMEFGDGGGDRIGGGVVAHRGSLGSEVSAPNSI
jgi:CRP-like cAMP-binding protein